MIKWIVTQLIGAACVLLFILAVGLMEGMMQQNTVTVWRVTGVILSFVGSGLFGLVYGHMEGFEL